MICSNVSIIFLFGVGKTDELELKSQVIPMLYNTEWSIKNQYMLKLEAEVICQLFFWWQFQLPEMVNHKRHNFRWQKPKTISSREINDNSDSGWD